MNAPPQIYRGKPFPSGSNFVKVLQKDEAAVRAAMSSEWSNGQTEGQVNRLKMLKRQMYGRANFDLLRARVLNSP
jgi:transposase